MNILQTYDIVIIGGGIVGLSTAMKMSQQYPDLNIAVIEKEDDLKRIENFWQVKSCLMNPKNYWYFK